MNIKTSQNIPITRIKNKNIIPKSIHIVYKVKNNLKIVINIKYFHIII